MTKKLSENANDAFHIFEPSAKLLVEDFAAPILAKHNYRNIKIDLEDIKRRRSRTFIVLKELVL